MLTGNLVRVRTSKARVIPLYLKRDDPSWLEAAESLLLIYREGVGTTRGEIEAEIDELLGDDPKTLAHRGLAKVLEDRCEFEMVADVPPDVLREKVFAAAAAHRKELKAAGRREHFRAEVVLQQVADEMGIDPIKVESSLFADLKDEARMLTFDDLSAQRLVDRYNVALAQAVLLRSVLVTAEVRREKPQRYRQLFRWLKFHRLLHRVDGSMAQGYTFHIDGPLSLFSSTTKYGLQMAMFLPALLLCDDFRLDAELRWGPKREPRTFHLESSDGLISHYQDAGTYVPPELNAFVERFRQVVPGVGGDRVDRDRRARSRGRVGPRLQVRPQENRHRRPRGSARILEEIEPGTTRCASCPSTARPATCWRSPRNSRWMKKPSAS